MNSTMVSIGVLQARLNDLMATTNLYTEDTREIYRLSEELDELIVEYYRQYKQ